MFCYALVLCFCALIGQSSPSAIPMWEYLSTQEKVSIIYQKYRKFENTIPVNKLLDKTFPRHKMCLHWKKFKTEQDI